MAFEFIISPELERRLDKLAHNDKPLALAVRKKIQQIINCDETTIHHFKNLRGGMSDYKRVQLGPFVLLFKVKKALSSLIGLFTMARRIENPCNLVVTVKEKLFIYA